MSATELLEGFPRLPASLHTELSRRLTCEQFRAILSYPTWNAVRHTMDYTRSYEAGLDAALMLLSLAAEYRESFTPAEHEHQMRDLYYLVLHSLDKLDRWEDYLRIWQAIRENTDYVSTYSRESRAFHGARIEPFILREDSQYLYVHFMYFGSHRKAVIERKLQRKQRGRPLGNQFHARPEELTAEQLHERVAWLMQFYRPEARTGA